MLVLLTISACSLLSPPENPDVPTPPPAPQAVVDFSDLPLVTNPVSSVTAGVDPDTLALLNGVSEQQLISYVQALENFGTRNTFSDTQRDDIGVGAARRWIHDEFLRVNGGALQVSYDDFVANIDGLATNQRNVVATLPGIGDHQGAIVLMAHYDSRSVDPNDGRSLAPGADDNASGVAILLELARLLSTHPWNQTIIFVAFAAEEQGTFGSRHFVQNMMLDGHMLDAAIDNDIVGGRPGIPQSLRIFSPGPDTTNSRQLARFLQLIGRIYTSDFGINLIDSQDREGRFSDHREFINAGIPGVRLTESEEDRTVQHGSNDTWERLDFNYLRQVAQLNLAAAANMAGAPSPPQALTVAAMANPGGYILTWPRDLQATGYAISFRPLGSQEHPLFRYVSTAEAGNVAYTDLDPETVYAVSLAAIGPSGRISMFSPETIARPGD